jgi:hypothetical protein
MTEKFRHTRARLEEEVRLAQYLQYPRIARVHGLFEIPCGLCVAMENIEGLTINTLLSVAQACGRYFSEAFIPVPLRDILHTLSRRKPAERFATAAELETVMRARLTQLGPYSREDAVREVQRALVEAGDKLWELEVPEDEGGITVPLPASLSSGELLTATEPSNPVDEGIPQRCTGVSFHSCPESLQPVLARMGMLSLSSLTMSSDSASPCAWVVSR